MVALLLGDHSWAYAAAGMARLIAQRQGGRRMS